MTGDEAYELLVDLEGRDSKTVKETIDALTYDDGTLANEAFSSKQEAFIRGISAGEWLARSGME